MHEVETQLREIIAGFPRQIKKCQNEVRLPKEAFVDSRNVMQVDSIEKNTLFI